MARHGSSRNTLGRGTLSGINMIDIERQSERLIRRLKLPDDVADLKIRIPHKAVEVGGWEEWKQI